MAIDTTKKVKKITVDGTEMELVGGSGTNKLAQIIDRSVTEITAEDLAGATLIGFYAFKNCSKLTNIEIPSTIKTISNEAFYASGLTSFTKPVSLTYIGDGAFTNCESLKTVKCDSIENWCNATYYGENSNPASIAGDLYINNELLINLVIPEGVTLIPSYTFRKLKSLATAVIASTVTAIRSRVFDSCPSLTTITILATTPPTLSNKNSISTATTTIYIPAGTLSAYQSATNWSSHASKFVELAE